MAGTGKFVKNIDNRTVQRNILGMDVVSGTYHEIEETELHKYAYEDSFLQDDLAKGYSIIARSDDGLKDIESFSGSITFLRNEFKIPLSGDGKKIVSQSYKPDETSVIIVTHDLSDPCSWFGDAQYVSGEELTVIPGTDNQSYSCDHWNLIDLRHARLTFEDNYADSYDVKVYVDDTEMKPEWCCNASGVHDGYTFGRKRHGLIGTDPATPLVFDGVATVKQTIDFYNRNIIWNQVVYNESDASEVPVSGTVAMTPGDFYVDYPNGQINFFQSVTGTVTCDHYYENGSTFYLTPKPGTQIDMLKSEIQFTKDIIIFSATNFEIWGYDPTGQVSPPEKVLLNKENYKSLKDLISTGNLGQGEIPAMIQLPVATVVFPFDYTGRKILKSSWGMELRISTDYDIPVSGTFGTGTFYINAEVE